MEASLKQHDQADDAYILMDLDNVYDEFDIPPNAPYVLSGLHTINPVLVIDNKVKLMGYYEETVGSCFVFAEENLPLVHEDARPSEASSSKGTCAVDPNHNNPTKEVKPIGRVQNVLKFRF